MATTTYTAHTDGGRIDTTTDPDLAEFWARHGLRVTARTEGGQ